MIEVFFYFLIIFILLPVSCGFIIALTNKFFYEKCGKQMRLVCTITSIIGTPVHELGHAVFCLIFGHKIVDIKLLQFNSNVLGYVSHTYNPKNIYHRIGNFFIGIGPIIFGGLIQIGLCYLLCNNVFDKTISAISSVSISEFNIKTLFDILVKYLEALFDLDNFSDFKWWIYMFVCLNISIHMNLSKPDIKGATSGLIFLVVTLFVISLVLYLIFYNNQYDLYDMCMVMINIAFIFTFISIIYSLVIDLLGLIISLIKKGVRR